MRGPGRFILQRALSEPLLLLAAFGSILLATTTLVSLALYTSVITEAGVKRELETAPIGTKAVTVTAPVAGDTFRRTDALVHDRVRAAYPGIGVTVTATLASATYAAPGQNGRKRPDLLVFGAREDLQANARLLAGAWPRDGEAVVSQQVAAGLRLRPGQVITVPRRVDGRTVTIRVSGVFQLDDPFGSRWANDPLLVRGAQTANYTTYGPLIVNRGTFLSRFGDDMSASWLAVPELRGVGPERLAPLAAGVSAIQRELVAGGCAKCGAASALPVTLNRLAVASTVARSTMLIPALQLLVLSA
ncbi:MAG: hypothetical protein HOY71_35125 [Nonomuraea sp.]|nr:hypothetical protein [Nonomuraea sp.]